MNQILRRGGLKHWGLAQARGGSQGSGEPAQGCHGAEVCGNDLQDWGKNGARHLGTVKVWLLKEDSQAKKV